MKKTLLSVFALIFFAVLAGPKIIGSKFEGRVNEIVASINAIPLYNASIDSMEGGWFSSEALIKVNIDMPEQMIDEEVEFSMDIAMAIDVSADHGPVLLTNGLSIGLLNINLQANSDTPVLGLVTENQAPLYKLTGEVSLSGAVEYQDEIAPMTYASEEHELQLNFEGMQGEGVLTADSFDYSARSMGLEIDVADMLNFSLNELEISSDIDANFGALLRQELYDSTSSIAIASMITTDMSSETTNVINNSNLTITTALDEQTNLMDGLMATSIDSISAGGNEFSELVFNIEVNRIQEEFIKAYQTLNESMLEAGTDTAAVELAMQDFMKNNLLGQLETDPEYNLSEISGKINNSAFSGNLLTKIQNVTALPDTLEDPNFWMQHALVTSQMSMEEGAALFVAEQIVSAQLAENPQFMSMSAQEQAQLLSQQAQATLQGLLQQGMIQRNGEVYEFSFSLEDSQATLNGNIIPL